MLTEKDILAISAVQGIPLDEMKVLADKYNKELEFVEVFLKKLNEYSLKSSIGQVRDIIDSLFISILASVSELERRRMIVNLIDFNYKGVQDKTSDIKKFKEVKDGTVIQDKT